MIFCCGAYHRADATYVLKSSNYYKDRILEIIYECPSKNEQCHAYIAELTQTNISTLKRRTIRKKNQDAIEYVKYLLISNELDCYPISPRQGSKSNMNWIYGKNKEIKDKKGNILEICQSAVDFNEQKKVIKHIYLPLNNNSTQ